jgi:hypothetical protein
MIQESMPQSTPRETLHQATGFMICVGVYLLGGRTEMKGDFGRASVQGLA